MPEAASQPVVDDTRIDLDAMRAARTQAPAPVVEALVEDDPEVKEDPELAAAIDEIEKPAENETPQQRSARTRKHKQTASKSQKTRYKNQRDDAIGKLTATEAELAEWKSGKRTYQAAPAAAPAKVEEPSKDDPKPVLKDFPLEQFTNEDDPYQAQAAALAEAVARWGARDERRKWDTEAHETRQREQASAHARDVEKAVKDSEAEARTQHADYDAVIGKATFPHTPASAYVLESIAESGVYGQLVYHLCTHPDRLHAILAMQTRRAVDQALGVEIADVKAALKALKEPKASPKVAAASEPAQPVSAGAGSGALLRNPMQDEGTSIDLGEVRAWRRASGGGR